MTKTKIRIVIVEDDPTTGRVLKESLEESGHEVTLCTDGEQGLTIIRETVPNIALLDLMLPRLDGLSLCRMIYIDQSLSAVSIIITSARSGEVDKIVALEAGADDYIVKPVKIGELNARINALLRRVKPQRVYDGILSVGPLEIHTIGRKVYWNGEQIFLQNLEFELLHTLASHRGQVLTRDTILALAWKDEVLGARDRRTVDVHVRWLREKIEDDPSKPVWITTIRGIGYRLEDKDVQS